MVVVLPLPLRRVVIVPVDFDGEMVLRPREVDVVGVLVVLTLHAW